MANKQTNKQTTEITKKLSEVQKYLDELKTRIIGQKALTILNKNYKETHKNDSINKLADRFLLKVKAKKIDNESLKTTFTYFIDLLVIDKNDQQKIKNMELQVLKHQLATIYEKCQNVGVVKTNNDNSYSLTYGLKHKTGIFCIKNMLLMLLANKKIVNKPPKKQKAKKSIKK